MKSNGKSFKIVSRFYVIYGDGIPIYVGYTNRSVKQRFVEHKHDKDFSGFLEVKSVELKGEKLSFDFTWDYEQTCKNADKVSLREGQLVQQYGTQDSLFQKADGGGQTWNIEKDFVRSNKDNPRFAGMSGTEIKARIEKEKIISIDISHFEDDMNLQYQISISDFVGHMNPKYQVDINSFVNNMKPQCQVDIIGFIKNMKTQYQLDIGSFVNNMKPQYQVNIGSFVSIMIPQHQADIRDFVNHMKHQYQIDTSNFVNNMKYQYQVDIHSFVNNMKWREQ